MEKISPNNRPNLVCIGIGTPERALEFCDLTKIDRQYLYSDADNAVYEALDLVKSDPISLITDVRTPLAMGKRIREGKGEYLKEAIQNWKPWIPPKLNQGLQQGGAFIFRNGNTIYGRKDPATGDHVNLNTLMNFLLQAA